MDLPTYTNIWRIEKRLYKLYDLRLPMPLPIVWVGVFLGVLVPWSVLLALVGVPFESPWHVLFIVPPGIVTWLSTRPVIESKRLNELLQSQIRYIGEPKTWCRLAPAEEPDEIAFTAKVWRAAPDTVRRAAPVSVKPSAATAASGAAKSRRGTRAKPKHTAPRRRPLEAWSSAARQAPALKRGASAAPGEVRPVVAAAAAAVTTLPVSEPPALVPGTRTPEPVREHASEAAHEHAFEGTRERVSEGARERVPEKARERRPEAVRERAFEGARERVPEGARRRGPEGAQGRPSQGSRSRAGEGARVTLGGTALPPGALIPNLPSSPGPVSPPERVPGRPVEGPAPERLPDLLRGDRPVASLPALPEPATESPAHTAEPPAHPVTSTSAAGARPPAEEPPVTESSPSPTKPTETALPAAPQVTASETARSAESGPVVEPSTSETTPEAGPVREAGAPAPIGTEALRRLRRLAASAESRETPGPRAVPSESERLASHEWPEPGRALPTPSPDRALPLPRLGPVPPVPAEAPEPASTPTPVPERTVTHARASEPAATPPRAPEPAVTPSQVPEPAREPVVRALEPVAEVSSRADEARAGDGAGRSGAETLGGGSAETLGDVPAEERAPRRSGGLAVEGREQHRKGQPPRAATPRERGREVFARSVSPEREAPPLSIRAVPAAGAGVDPAVPSVPVPGPRAGGEPRVRRVESVVGRDQTGGWRRLAQVVVGGGAPSRNDGIEADEARARTVLTGSRRVVVLGCTGGAGQTTTTLMLGHILARYREDRVLAVDANTGENTLTGRIAGDSPETLTSLMAGLDGVSGYLSMRAYTTRCDSGLEVVGADADAGAARRLADRRLFSDERIARAMRVLDRHYRLILVDPAAAVAARMLAYADQLILVAPASEDAPDAVAMTFDWLDGQTTAELRRRSIMVINGVSRRSMAGVEQAEAVARGRCRAIVRIPWEDELAPGRPGPAQPERLRAGARRAYVALAGVVASGLAAASRPSEEEVAQ
ncbi:hypothetical protein Skr01_45280 [Sphaerisporangium krabiense]|uniref:MinD-like ATPase involved in chromosome partitioning or flagellar assembly n=1 Tax=Sphaerisporangium krabiense TaxID=763782 RepID=A0A7W8Z547_9ACTN|nr:TcpE family conjugal transfer membrane protein [Sphaerisporangium krabiense]MBB5627420.1 MinD-like ATPase involved in chromosome partitioning or flagellar assembly [Sphaerisporangium krabiense]GII64443.1 hypothetical protein Skr01_45280 [Sphaerisporangium krabiense]